MTKKQSSILVCFVLLGSFSWGCSGGELIVTMEPILGFPPEGRQANEAVTGEALIDVWDIRTVSEGLPQWESFRVVEILSADGKVIRRDVHEQVNTDPPKIRRQSQEISMGITIEEIQIGREYWQYTIGRKDFFHRNSISLTAPTGLEWLLSATIEDVQLVGEETVNGFKTQHYTLSAVDSTAIVGTGISGDFWLSTKYRFVVKAEWQFLMGTFGSGSAAYELTDINIPMEIPPPTMPAGS